MLRAQRIPNVLIIIIISMLGIQTSKSQTNGPTQIEFSKSSGGSGASVNEFTGGFTESIPVLTIPGPDGSSYSMSLTYQSGSSPTEPASWVGFGWTLNPGAIVRQKRGFPDDYKDVKVKYWNKTRESILATRTSLSQQEACGQDFVGSTSIKIRNSFSNYIGYTHSQENTLSSLFGSVDGYYDDKGNLIISYNWTPYPYIRKLFGKETAVYLTGLSKLASSYLSNLILTPSRGTYSVSQMPTINNTYTGNGDIFFPTYRSGSDYLVDENDIPLLQEEVTKINTQSVTEKQVYGYLYTGEVHSKEDVMDYYTEKDNDLKKSEKFIGMPFPNNDNYIVTGGINGTFRAINRKIPYFRPPYSKSHVENSGWGLTTGCFTSEKGDMVIPIGADIIDNSNDLTVEEWADKNNNGFTKSSYKDSTIFKFYGERSPLYYNNMKGVEDKVLKKCQNYSDYSELTGFKEKIIPDTLFRNQENIIEYNTLKTIRESNYSNQVIQSRYLKENIKQVSGFSEELILEYSIINTNGTRYNYGLPVFSRNEKELNYAIHSNNKTTSSPTWKEENVLVNLNTNPDKSDIVIGTELNEPYVSSYLLTEIYTDDYVDVKGDGPSYDDIGGYVLFNYKRVAGDNIKRDMFTDDWKEGYKGYGKEQDDKWYKWRLPYSGLLYSHNSLSDYQDDMGSFSMGETEIYYLESIETKTNKAYFITNKSDIWIQIGGKTVRLQGSGLNRQDSYEANHSEYLATGGQNGYIENTDIIENKLEFLEKIILVSKDISKLNNNPENCVFTNIVSTQYMQYDNDYSTWPNQPNSINQAGKLTLKRVWKDNSEIKNFGVSPYEFGYIYNNNELPDNLKVNSIESPEFLYSNIDTWGNYQQDGNIRKTNYETWVNQNPSNSFDPAAWNLKTIKYPSGAELRIQYEQNEYTYVQDRRAEIMLSLDDLSSSNSSICSRINIDNYISDLNKYFSSNKLYYSFLFGFDGTSPSIYDLNSEFINGFTSASAVKIGSNIAIIPIANNSYSPLTKAYNYYLNNRRRYLIDYNGTQTYLNKVFYTSYMDEIYVKNKLNGILQILFPGLDYGFEDINIGDLKCSTNKSYYKLPIPKELSKKGGGIRAKRLINIDRFDNVMEGGEVKLYGKEYYYIDKAGNCSGVATNEPNSLINDNTLKVFLDRATPDGGLEIWNTTNGSQLSYEVKQKNYDEYVGPLGESILPAPSIGYSNVFVQSINSINDKTNEIKGGIYEKTFYTCNDYPNKNLYTNVADNYRGSGSNPNKLTYPYTNSYTYHYITQGYVFITNDMHGQIKEINTYKGIIDITHPEEIAEITKKPTQTTRYNYYSFGSQLPIYNIAKNKLESDYLGLNIEIFNESKSIGQTNISRKWDGDIEIIFTFPYFRYLGLVPSINISTTKLFTNVTTKVVRYPALVQSVETIIDGITNKVENIAYDRNTSKAVISRTNDGFNELELGNSSSKHNGNYYSLEFPAHSVYNEFSNKSYTENMRFSSKQDTYSLYRRISYEQSTSENKYSLIFDFNSTKRDVYGPYANIKAVKSYNNLMANLNTDNYWESFYVNQFTNGDIIEVSLKGTSKSENKEYHREYYQVKNVSANMISLYPLGKTVIMPNSKDEVDVRIIKSGRKNWLNENFANLMTYGKEMDIESLISLKQAPLDISKESVTANMPDETDKKNFINEFNNIVKNTKSWSIGQTKTLTQIGNATILNLLNKLKFKDIDGNPVTLSGDDIILTQLPGDNYSSSIRVKIDVIKDKNIDSPTEGINYVPPLIDKLNEFYTNLYTVKLNRLIPEIDWSSKEVYGADPKFVNDSTLVKDDRYQVFQIKDGNYIKLIKEKLGYYDLLNSSYELNGNTILGSDIITDNADDIKIDMLTENGNDYVKGTDIFVIVDRYRRDIILGLFTMKIKDLDYPIGVIRTHYNNAGANNQELYFKNGDWLTLSKEQTTGLNYISYLESEVFNKGNFSIHYDVSKIIFKIPVKLNISIDLPANKTNLTKEICSVSYYWYLYGSLFDGFSPFYLNDHGQIGVTRIDKAIGKGTGYELATPYTWSKDFPCLEFFDDYEPSFTIESGVLRATATIATQDWEPYNRISLTPENNTNKFLSGEEKTLRGKEGYTYKDEIKKGVGTSERIYSNAGELSNKFYLINPKGKTFFPNEIMEHWKKGSSITKYTQYGDAIESQDILGNKHCISFGQPGYNYFVKVVPTEYNYICNADKIFAKEFTSMVASNSSIDNCGFQSWEYELNITMPENLVTDNSLITSSSAHCGKYSRNLSKQVGKAGTIDAKTIRVFSKMKLPENMITSNTNYDAHNEERGVICKLWAKTDKKPVEGITTTPDCQLCLLIADNSLNIQTSIFSLVKQVGEWSLYTAELKDWGNNNDVDVYVKTSTTTDENIYIDDILFKPRESYSQCYVYDYKLQRLTDVLDDNHFALHYQYNFEGNMTRVMKETEIGMRTIIANSYNSYIIPRYSFTQYGQVFGKVNNKNNKKEYEQIPSIYEPELPMEFKPYDEDGDINNNGIKLNQKIDLFKLNASPDKQNIKILDIDGLSEPTLDSLPNIEKIKPNSDKIIKGIENQYNEVKTEVDSTKNSINNAADSIKRTGDKIKKTEIKYQNNLIEEELKKKSESKIKELKKEEIHIK